MNVKKGYIQNVNEPAITALAIAVGKIRCASRVMGYDRKVNITGGITSLSLGRHGQRRSEQHVTEQTYLSMGR